MAGNDVAVEVWHRLEDALQVAQAAVPYFLTTYYPRAAQKTVYRYEQSYYWP